MTYTEIINRVSTELGISPDIVNKAYKSFWLYIKDSIQDYPLKEDMTKEEFLKLRTNFNIPSLGKLTCTYDKYLRIKDRFNNIKNIREKNEEVD